MYKNGKEPGEQEGHSLVSILVLMDLCIKTHNFWSSGVDIESFNPCFNGSMYKNRFLQGMLYPELVFQSLF